MSPHARVAVVTDSTSYLPAELVREHGIEVVPLQVVIGGTSYDEGVRRVARHGRRGAAPLAAGDHVPPGAGDLAAGLHARRPSAAARRWCRCTCRRRCPGPSSRRGWRPRSRRCRPRWSTPGRSAWASGSPWCRLRSRRPRGGRPTRSRGPPGTGPTATSAVFYVDTLEYLRRGGRIGAAAAMLGSALAVKPLLHLVDGHIEPLEKVRTAAKAIARLEEVAAGKAGSRTVDVAVHHLASADRAEALAGRLRGRLQRAGGPARERGRRRGRRARRAGDAGRGRRAALTLSARPSSTDRPCRRSSTDCGRRPRARPAGFPSVEG